MIQVDIELLSFRRRLFLLLREREEKWRRIKKELPGKFQLSRQLQEVLMRGCAL